MGEDGRSLKQKTHEKPFKKLIWKFSLVSRYLESRKNFAGISQVSLTRKTAAKQSRNSLSKAENTLKLDHLTPSWAYIWNRSRKHPENMFFTQKQFENFEKHGWYKSLPKANKKNKNLFGLNQIRLSTHTSHLNMYNHTNEIEIHWTKVLCVVCGNQVWNSP